MSLFYEEDVPVQEAPTHVQTLQSRRGSDASIFPQIEEEEEKVPPIVFEDMHGEFQNIVDVRRTKATII